MNRIERAIQEIHKIDYQSREKNWLTNLNPIVKLSVTILYLLLVVSFGRYELTGLTAMVLYLIVHFELSDLKFRECVSRLRIVIPFLLLLGIFHPFFNREIMFNTGGIGISKGVISMITLIEKGSFALIATYLFFVTTGMEKLCCGLRKIHVPKIMVTVLLLIGRYLVVLLKETNALILAYSLRAPNQKGISYKAWGTLAGQLLLRSIDRAQTVYESMSLRGFHGEFYLDEEIRMRGFDFVYLALASASLLFLWKFPLFEWIGALL